MIDICEFRRAGRSKKIRSWITDPLRSLACSFLWPYLNRLLIEIDKQSQLHRELDSRVAELQGHLNSVQRQLESRVNVVKEIEALGAKHAHLGARVASVQKDAMATAMRLASLESVFISYREKNLQLEDGGKVSIDGTSLVLAASNTAAFC